ncbi:MAG TPA: hypothetical protein VIS78_02140, partial [Blastocatellia bacterium]
MIDNRRDEALRSDKRSKLYPAAALPVGPAATEAAGRLRQFRYPPPLPADCLACGSRQGAHALVPKDQSCE